MKQRTNLVVLLSCCLLLLLSEQAACFSSFLSTSTSTFKGRRVPTYIGASVEEDQSSTTSGDAASLRSITFSNLLNSQEPQLLCNFLMELGACSTSITDADRGSPDEEALFDEFDAESMTRTAVTTHVWNHCNVSAHFPASTDLQWIMEIVQDTFEDLPKYTVTQVENKDWVLHVQQSWKPIVLPPFCLRFPWHTNELVEEALEKADFQEQAVEIQLQGGIAFGTGEHPTTQLCLNWISQICKKDDVRLLMDYGAGSGVLGMAACKLNPSITAVGVDIDVDAVHIANANAQDNAADMVNYLSDLVKTQGDSESQSVLLKAYSSQKGSVAEVLPDDRNGPIYDACVANILAQPLVVLAPILAGLLKPGGYLGLSGIMESQGDMIVETYEEYFDNVKVEERMGGWVLVTGDRKEE